MGEKIVINGKRKLSGSINLMGAKNSVLPIICACLVGNGKFVIKNTPKIKDIYSMLDIFSSLGGKYTFNNNCLSLDSSSCNNWTISSEKTKTMRSSIFMLGALLSRFKRAKISYPGGCVIGKRPIDLHIKSLKKLGVEFIQEKDEIICSSFNARGNVIRLDYPSVGATENIILLATKLKGETIIYNSAREPEIVDLAKFLNKMGAKIFGAGSSIIVIEGVKRLHGVEFMPVCDRIEAGTYLLATAITGGEIEIRGINKEKISSLLNKILNNTCNLNIKDDIIYFKSGSLQNCFDFSTSPYPGFPTDLQPQTVAYLSICDGSSLVKENVFENRFGYVWELIKMGADIRIQNNSLLINGVRNLHGENVMANDLRGGASLIVAGLSAEGQTIIDGVCHIDRGYDSICEKLQLLGAEIKRILL